MSDTEPKPLPDARTLTAAEFKAAKRQMVIDGITERRKRAEAATLARLARKWGKPEQE